MATRDELNERAVALGIEPDQFSKKEELASAIEAAEQARDEQLAEDEAANVPAPTDDPQPDPEEVDVYAVVATIETLDEDEVEPYIAELSPEACKALLLLALREGAFTEDDLDEVEQKAAAPEPIVPADLEDLDREDLVVLTPISVNEGEIVPVGDPVPDSVEDDELERLARGGHIGA